MRVLVVEDDEDDAWIVKAMLRKIESLAIEADWCEDPHEAIPRLATGQYAVALFDHFLGVRTGIGLLAEARRANVSTPIILLTGQGGSDIDLQAISEGAAEYLEKSDLSPATLERLIRRALVRQTTTNILRQRATHDGLTELLNRGEFDRRLAIALQDRRRVKPDVALVIADIDHFKRINDAFGHPAGDAVLRRVATVIKHTTRRGDHCARYGGEEFALILPGTDKSGALVMAKRVLDALRGERIQVQTQAGVVDARVTVSLGVAVAWRHSKQPEGLIRAADQALYRAKNAGRDCVRFAESTKDDEPVKAAEQEGTHHA